MQDQWDALDRKRLEAASSPELSADLAVMMVEEGRAVLQLIGGSVTVQKARIEANLPRKTGAASAGFEKAFTKFLESCYQAIVRNVNWEVGEACVRVAGAGCWRCGGQSNESQSVKMYTVQGMESEQMRLAA